MAEPRPRAFPPPQFPPHRPKLFARTPPAIFPPILGLLGLGLALRQGLGLAEVEAVLGIVLALWAFAVLAMAVKVARRPGVVTEDLRVLPGRAGLAAASMGGMAAAAVLTPFAPGMALWLVGLSLAVHLVLAGLLVRLLLSLPPEGREVTPALHLSFVGFIVGAMPLARLGHVGAAEVLFWVTLPVAVVIWALSLRQLIRFVPPAPLRPMLAIHLAPAALLSTVAGVIGQGELAWGLAGIGAVILLLLVAFARWLLASGFTPFWGAMTFPLAAYATAVLSLTEGAGLGLLVGACALVLPVAWKVLSLWPGNRLAQKSNAAEA